MVVLAVPGGVLAQEPTPQVMVPGGEYRPFYPVSTGAGADAGSPAPEPFVTVSAFRMDTLPVTNAQFLAFVTANPKWRRGAAAALFVDDGYLRHWAGPDALGPDAGADQPVVYISWFAARSYCRAQGGRLPTEDEWEFVARADAEAIDASDDPAFLERILAFYSKPRSSQVPNVGQGAPNAWGLYDVHGLVWEWVEDFNASLLTGDNRQAGDQQLARFCGGASLGAENIREVGLGAPVGEMVEKLEALPRTSPP